MHVTYTFVYTFGVFMACLTLCLTIFVLKPLRKPVFSYLKRIKLSDNIVIISAIYIAYAIVLVILADSIWTYMAIKNTMNLEQGAPMLNDYQVFEKTVGTKDYMSMFKKERQFYLAERNFMLTISSLIAAYMYHRFVGALYKLTDIQDQIETGVRNTDTSLLTRY